MHWEGNRISEARGYLVEEKSRIFAGTEFKKYAGSGISRLLKCKSHGLSVRIERVDKRAHSAIGIDPPDFGLAVVPMNNGDLIDALIDIDRRGIR